MMMKPLPLVLALASLSGCAHLKVHVAVLDPSYPQEAAHDAALTMAAIALVRGDMTEPVRVADQLDAVRRDQINRCFDAWIANGADAVAANADRDLALKQPNPGLATERSNDLTEFTRLDSDARASISASGRIKADSTGKPAQVAGNGEAVYVSVLDPVTRSAMVTRETGYQLRLQAVQSQYASCPAYAINGKAVSVKLEDVSPVAAAAVAVATKSNIEKVAYTSNIGGGKLLFDQKEAYFVAKAPERVWAPQYNKAVGEGQGGGTDIVVKLNDTADFTIKGMVFDARSTVNMISKVGTSVLKVMAASQGLGSITAALPKADPAPAADAPKPDASGAEAMQSVADAEAEQAAAAARQRNFDAQLMRTANHILAAWPQLIKSNATAKKSVKDSFAAGKAASEGVKQ
jgi:hypothetical protein